VTNDFRAGLLASGLLIDIGVDGLYGRSATFQRVVRGIDGLVNSAGADQHAAVLHFPAVIPRFVLERNGYVRSFPDLLGSVSLSQGGEELHAKLLARLEHGDDWAELLTSSDLALSSAACQPLYPTCSGRLPDGGRRFEISGECFRYEPGLDPARMLAFRQHELVHLGDPYRAVAHRDVWLERFVDLLSGLGLAIGTVIATDPFFGRTGRMLASNQRAETLKYEIVFAAEPDDEPKAISSSNYHLDHFRTAFGIESASGDGAHTACNGFGVERVTLAPLSTHELDPDTWPPGIPSRLWP
jgi:seryl-tRNA synthetase